MIEYIALSLSLINSLVLGFIFYTFAKALKNRNRKK